MPITETPEVNVVLISGYRFRWDVITFFRILLFSGSISIISFLLSRATDIGSVISIGVILLLVILFAIILHSKTKIHFSEEHIKVSYGWLPFVRTLKTKNLKQIRIEYDESSSEDGSGGGFTYLVLIFSKQWNIKIIVGPLLRKERDALTGRLSYLKSKFVNEQYEV